MSVIRNSAWSALNAIVTAVGRFAFAIFLAREFDASSVGAYFFAAWAIETAYLVSALGKNQVTSRRYAEQSKAGRVLPETTKRWLSDTRFVTLLSTLVALVAFAIFSKDFDLKLFAAVVFWSMSFSIQQLSNAALVGLMNFRTILISNIAWLLLIFIGASQLTVDSSPQILFYVSGCASLIGALISGLFLISRTDNSLRGQVPGEKYTTSFALNVWASGLLWSLAWNRGEYPVVKGILGEAALAEYGLAMSIFGGATQAIMLLVGGVLPTLNKLWGQKKKRKAILLSRIVMDIQVFIAGLCSIFLILYAPMLVELAVGNKFVSAAKILQILSFGLIALAFTTSNHLLQSATNGVAVRNLSIVVVGFLYISATFLSQWGLEALAIARALSLLLFSLISYFYSSKQFGPIGTSKRNFLICIGIQLLTMAIERSLLGENIYLRTVTFAGLSILLMGSINLPTGSVLRNFAVPEHRLRLLRTIRHSSPKW